MGRPLITNRHARKMLRDQVGIEMEPYKKPKGPKKKRGKKKPKTMPRKRGGRY